MCEKLNKTVARMFKGSKTFANIIFDVYFVLLRCISNQTRRFMKNTTLCIGEEV